MPLPPVTVTNRSYLCIHTADLAFAEKVCASACECGVHSAAMRLDYLHKRCSQTGYNRMDFNSDNYEEKSGYTGMAHSPKDKQYLTATVIPVTEPSPSTATQFFHRK
ncbi:hypothetical protein I79_025769 [Cricetulus griseus]|uniref:Uncharacterized protein n=1 Tax=Cricetulus griseus TaxID=10029 RepID=G3IP66_CRIGR|nr:hypothetical protein I79_025769 [Cricetulus griseus]